MDVQAAAARLIVVRAIDAELPRQWTVAVDLGVGHEPLRLIAEPADRETCEIKAGVFRAAVTGWVEHLRAVGDTPADIAEWLFATVLTGEPCAPVDRLRRWQIQLKFHADAGPVLMETRYLDDVTGSTVAAMADIARRQVAALLDQNDCILPTETG